MEKRGLVKVLSEKLNLTIWETERFLNAFIDMSKVLLAEGDEVRLPRLGKLHIVTLPEQRITDNLHGAPKLIILPPRKVVKFTPFDSCLSDIKYDNNGKSEEALCEDS